MTKMAEITVIIPTYKRPRALLEALQSLQEQTFPKFEILVMDNAADPVIERLVIDFNQTARIAVKYFPEPKLGVHFARNAAAKIAAGELLLYTDDDMTFSPDWVANYQKAFWEHPEMAAAGGPVRPFWEQEPPQWLVNYISNSKSFGILSLMEPYDSFQLSDKGYFFSCNMGIQKQLLLERGGFHPEATGNIWLGDGETGLNMDMCANGDLIGYVPDALAHHHIPPLRMTPAYFRLRMANQGASNTYTRFHDAIPNSFNLLLRIAKKILFGLPVFGMALVLWNQTSRTALNVQMQMSYVLSEINYMLKLILKPSFRKTVLQRDWVHDVEYSVEK